MTKKNKNSNSGINMKDVIPFHNVKYQEEDSGAITIFKPKFKNSFFVKYILPNMKHPHYFIHLDELGTVVWNNIDGKRNAFEIGEIVEKELGEKTKPIYERLGLFLATLKRENFIDWE